MVDIETIPYRCNSQSRKGTEDRVEEKEKKELMSVASGISVLMMKGSPLPGEKRIIPSPGC